MNYLDMAESGLGSKQSQGANPGVQGATELRWRCA